MSASEEADGDDDRLVSLFRNRAELKREFAELRDERFRLEERVREEQGATARVKQQLEHLENLLFDPKWSASVAVHYQLRSLHRRCESRVARFAERLKSQREQRANASVKTDWQAERDAAISALERRIGDHRLQTTELEEQLQQVEDRSTQSGVRRLLTGTELEARQVELQARIASFGRQEKKLLAEYDRLRSEEGPEIVGLDIDTKRSINFLVLAFVQHLYQVLDSVGVAGLVKEAADKSVGGVNYGTRRDCDAILRRADSGIVALRNATADREKLAERARRLAEQARFRFEDDVVPIAASVATFYRLADDGSASAEDLNLLGEDYWSVGIYLSR